MTDHAFDRREFMKLGGITAGLEFPLRQPLRGKRESPPAPGAWMHQVEQLLRQMTVAVVPCDDRQG
jgi:hypothetical protein